MNTNLKNIMLSLLLVISQKSFGQDTIYAEGYSEGVIVNSYKEKGVSYLLDPIEGNTIVKVGKSSVYKICTPNGIILNRENFKHSDFITIPTNKKTGKISYSAIVKFDSIDVRSLRAQIKKFPITDPGVEYKIAYCDDNSPDEIIYVGKFSVKYNFKPTDVVFTLYVKIKEGKIKYEFTDFLWSRVTLKAESWGSSIISPYSPGLLNHTVYNQRLNEDIRPLELFYITDRKTKNENLIKKIDLQINSSVDILKRICKKGNASSRDDGW